MASSESPNKYLLEEMVWCLRCSRQMQPASRTDGSRYYSCGVACEQRDQPAIPLEQDLLLRALVRARQALFGVGRQIIDHSQADATRPGHLLASRDELRRWQYCNVTDRRVVLLAAFTRVMIDVEGAVCAVWRHEQEAAANRKLAQATPC